MDDHRAVYMLAEDDLAERQAEAIARPPRQGRRLADAQPGRRDRLDADLIGLRLLGHLIGPQRASVVASALPPPRLRRADRPPP